MKIAALCVLVTKVDLSMVKVNTRAKCSFTMSCVSARQQCLQPSVVRAMHINIITVIGVNELME